MSASEERRAFLGGALAAVAAGACLAPRAGATDYASAAEVLDALDAAAADVQSRLRALAGLPPVRQFAERLLQEHARQATGRARLRRRLGLALAAPRSAVVAGDRSLPALRAAQEALVFAHAEGLPALRDAAAVDQLGRAMVVASRHLTLIDLWIEGEESRG